MGEGLGLGSQSLPAAKVFFFAINAVHSALLSLSKCSLLSRARIRHPQHGVCGGGGMAPSNDAWVENLTSRASFQPLES